MSDLRQKARDLVAYAERKGVIQKPKVCEWCGENGKLVKHHPDYGEPVRIVWICTRCHGVFHNKLRKGMRYHKVLH